MSIQGSTKKLLGTAGTLVFFTVYCFIILMEYVKLIKVESYSVNVMLIYQLSQLMIVLILGFFAIKTAGGTVQQVMKKKEE